MSLGGATGDMALVVRARNLASKTLRTVGRDLDAVSAKTATVNRGFAGAGAMGVKALGGVTLAVGALGAIGVVSFAKFDDKMTQSLAIMGDVGSGMRDEMEKTAREVGTTTRFGAAEAAEAYFFLASAGLDAEQSIASMPQVAMFAQAGMFDLARATDLATDAQSALGLTVKDPIENLTNLTRITDVLVKANTLANASVEQFSEALTNKAGAAAKVTGIEIEEITALLAAFADQGFKGQVAGEMASRALKGLQINALANEDAFKRLGVRVFDDSGEMVNLADIVGDLTKSLGGMSDAQKTQALLDLGFSARQQDVFKVLLGTEGKIRDYEAALRDAGGTTKEVADKQLTSISAKWDLFKSKISDVFLAIGKGLAPAIRKLLPWLSKMAEKWIPRMIKGAKQLFKWLGKMLTPVFRKLGAAIKMVRDWFARLSPQWKDAIKFGAKAAGVFILIATAVKILTFALGLLASPVLLVIAAIIALAAGLKYAWENSETFRNIVQGLATWFTESFVPAIVGAWDHIWEVMSQFITRVTDIVSGIIGAINGIVEFVKGVFTGDWKRAWQGIKDFLSGIWKAIGGAVSGAWAIVVSTVTRGLQVIGSIWRASWGGIKAFFGGVWETMKNVMRGAVNFMIRLINGLISAINVVAEYGSIVGILPFVNVPDIPHIPTIGSGGEIETATAGTSYGRAGRNGIVTNSAKAPAPAPNVTIVVGGGTSDEMLGEFAEGMRRYNFGRS